MAEIWNLIILEPVLNSLIALSTYLANNFGLAIIVLTIVVRFILFPLTVRQTRSTKAMQSLQPKIQELQKKYARNQQKMQQEIESFLNQRQQKCIEAHCHVRQHLRNWGEHKRTIDFTMNPAGYRYRENRTDQEGRSRGSSSSSGSGSRPSGDLLRYVELLEKLQREATAEASGDD